MVLLMAVAVWRMRVTGENPGGDVVRPPVLPSAPKAAPEARAMATASPAADAGLPKAGQVVARFGWGAGNGNLGRDRPQEGNPEGPMSVTIDSKGTSSVLDQVNRRVVRVDKAGQRLPSIELPLQAPQDLVVAKDGTTVVMDRLVDKSIALISPDGVLRGELPLLGKGLREGGAATGVFTDGDSVYVERTHGDSVRIGSVAGVKDVERPEIPGRPARDGRSYLTASIASGKVLLTVIDASTRAHRFTRQYSLAGPVSSLVLLDADVRGVVYVGAMVGPEVQVLCVDALDGHPMGTTAVPASASADEAFRELAVSDDGEILALLRDEAGAELRRFRCP